MLRRSFMSYVVTFFAAMSAPQKAIMQNGQAVVCDSDSLTCPNGHKTCKSINAPVVVGNDNREYPDTAQLFEYHLERCQVCKVAFFRE